MNTSLLRFVLFVSLCFTSFLNFASPINCFELTSNTGKWSPSVYITNHCGTAVDLQNSELQFHANQNVTGSYWGDFGNIAYPAETTIYSEYLGSGDYLIRMPLIFPTGGDGWHPKTTIDNNAKIKIQFSSTPDLTINQLAFYTAGSPPEPQISMVTFSIPAEPTANSPAPTITVTNNNNYSQTLSNVSWNSTKTLESIPYGEYDIIVNDIQVGTQTWKGSATPAHVTLNTAAGAQVNIQYQAVVQEQVQGNIQGLPGTSSAEISVTDENGLKYVTTAGNGQSVLWQLPIYHTYQVSVGSVSDGSDTFIGTATPNSFYLNENQNLVLNISYQKATYSTRFSPYVDVTLGTITRWDSATQSMQPLGLLDAARDSGVRSFHLAFVTGQSGCHGTWAGYPVSQDPNGFGVPVFQQLKQQGVELIVAFGGLSGQYLAQVCQSDAELKAAYEEVITAYHPDVLDFDVENNMQTNNTQLDRMMRVIKSIQTENPSIRISFTLPVLPSGLVPGVGENVIQRAALGGLTDYGVNIMAMDYGSSFQNKTMGEYAIDAATSTFNQLKAIYPNQSDETLWHRIEVTPMIGLNDTLPLNFSLTDVQTLVQFARLKSLGLLSYWAITRDHPCDSDYVSITCSSKDPATGLPNQQTDYQFAKTFMQ